MKAWATAVAATLLLLGGCGDDAPAKCGSETCTDREQCNMAADPPVCECQDAYTGDECAACAFGYRPTESGECEPVPIDCDADPLICGDHGTCTVTVMRDVKVHACECEEGWAGHVCQRCDTGWQDNDGDGVCMPTCEMVGLSCDAPLVCSDAAGVARCACPTGYAGDDCTLCARGYHDPTGSGTCSPTCATATLECGENMACDDSTGDPRCACMAGFAGDDCSECAAGWQPGPLSGDCRPTCDVTELDCNDHGSCADGDGIPRCACDTGWAGAGCTECAPGHRGEECELCNGGWYREGDGPCIPTCASGTVRCGSEQRCWDGPDGPECVCEIGYEGADCAACADGYAADASGYCVPSAPSTHTLVAGGTWRGRQALVAIDPADGSVFPLRSTTVTRLAYDPDTDRLLDRVSGGFAEIDLATGLPMSTVSTTGFDAFAYDTMRDTLVLVSSSAVGRANAVTGTYTYLASGVSWASDAAYDATRDRVVVSSRVSSTGMTLVTAGTGATSGTLTSDLPIETSGGVGLAMGSGDLYVLGRRRLDEDERAIEACRRAALGILGEDYGDAPGTVVEEPAPGATVTMASTRSSGPEVVVLRSYGNRSAEVAVVRITADNPDAVVCVGTYEGVYRIEVASTARFAATIAESYEPTLSARVDSGYPAPPSPTVHVLVREPDMADASLSASTDVLRVYSSEEWSTRRIAIYSASAAAGGVLLRLDPVSGTVLATTPIPELIPSGSLTSWAP